MRTVSLQPLDLAIARAFGVMDDAVPSPDPGTPVVETVEIDGDVGELILQIAAQALPSENSGTLTVEIETSPDNSTWTSVFSQEFTTSGSETAAVAGDTYLRVTATPSGDTGRATVNVTATPSIIDKTSGGGSTPEQGVQVKFDTPNLYTQAFDITAVDLEAQTVTIAGDHTDLFPVGVWLNIVGSTGNDSPYLIADVAFAGGNTVVTVDPAAWSPLGNDTADGQLVNTGTAGITIYTPQAGDILYLMVNETGPIISTFEAFDQVVDAHFASLDYQNGDLAVIVQPFEQDNWTGFHVTQTTDQYAISPYPWQALRFADTTPFKMFVTANASLLPPDPLPSMGRSVVVPNVIRGPEYPA